jgi:hypothetical protein
MPNTFITLGSTREGKPQSVNVEMTSEELKSAVIGGGSIVQLPTGEGDYVYVNPAYIVMARETSDDGPSVRAF